MIPRDYITAWRQQAPWVQDVHVEQDLVISRALVEIFSDPVLRDALAFRGGTALYKLHLRPAARYSEDIDLVHTKPEPAGSMMDAVRRVLDPWLGQPTWKQTEGRVTFVVSSDWFDGACEIQSYELDELLGTKLRALYQRKWGRDLFDLSHALAHASADPARVVHAFSAYMTHEGHRVTRAQFEENVARKLRDPVFRADISPLLAADVSWDLDAAATVVLSRLVALLPGDPWKAPHERRQ